MSNAINIIENKPHRRYIRYLLTKRYSPRVIKRDLQRLGFSSPHEKIYHEYWMEFIDPIVKKHKLSHVFSDYKGKMTSKTGTGKNNHEYVKDLLKFQDFKSREKDQINFIAFAEELEILDLWMYEMASFYGEKSRSPVDDKGDYILKDFRKVRRPTLILDSPHRYVIDEMILEDVSHSRIANYMRENYQMEITLNEVGVYRNIFFSIAKDDITDKIKAMEIEKAFLEEHIDDIEAELQKDMDEGDAITLRTTKKELAIRCSDIGDNIRKLSSVHLNSSVYQKMAEAEDYSSMMDTAARRLFARFSMLDEAKDRDIVAPITAVVKTMGYAMEKSREFKAGESGGGDRHAKAMTVSLISSRQLERIKEDEEIVQQTEGAEFRMDDGDIDINSIAGIDELNIASMDE